MERRMDQKEAQRYKSLQGFEGVQKGKIAD
jgi:hypothetical protein